jgi:hypothetical protein
LLKWLTLPIIVSVIAMACIPLNYTDIMSERYQPRTIC